MNSEFEKIYLRAPVFLQNILISLYGFNESRIRYCGSYKKFIKEITPNYYLSKDEIKILQEKNLRILLKCAMENVPFYKKEYIDFSKDIEKIKICDLKKLPVLEKKTVKKSTNKLTSNKISKGKIIQLHTTGTTGTPLKINCIPEVRQKNYAFFSRFLRIAGIDPKGKRATFGGRIVVDYKIVEPPYWRYSLFQKNKLFSSYHLSKSTMKDYIDALTKYKPSYIDAYPSSIYLIAKYADSNGLSLRGLTQGIVTSSEVLQSNQRDLIEKTFGVPVFDQYGCAEMCVFAAQCKYGKYHIHSDYSIVEIVNEDGRDAEPGEEAEIICTGLINPVMPLIRYRIGDKVIMSTEKCKCGSNFPVIEKIIGKTDDYLISPDGRKIGRIGSVLRGVPVYEAQYIQEKKEEVILNVVKDKEYSDTTEKKIEYELRKRIGYDMKIKIRYVDKIERGKGGKYKTVVSKLY